MSLPIYKPNAANKGSLFSFNFGPAKKGGDHNGDLALYVNAVQQATWNPATKTGSFKENAKDPAKTLNIKINEFEVGGFLNAIQRRTEFKGYHTFPGGSGSIQFSFTPSEKEGVFIGFLFSVLRSSDKAVFRIGITAPEAMTLFSFLDFGLKRLWTNRAKNSIAAQAQRATTAAPAKPAAAPTPEPEAEQDNPFGSETATSTEEEKANDNPFG